MATINLSSGADNFSNSNNDGSNIINGLEGNDSFWLNSTFGTDFDTINGGAGYDTVYLSSSTATHTSSTSGNTVYYYDSLDSFSISIFNGAASIEYAIYKETVAGFTQQSARYSFSISNIEELHGGASNDNISIGSTDGVARAVYGEDGNDILNINGLDPILASGGNGNDDISAVGLCYIFGDAGNDTIGSLAKLVDGSFIHGGDNNDYIAATGNSIILYGDDGDDYLTSDNSHYSDLIDNTSLIVSDNSSLTLDGGTGNDTLVGQHANELFIGGTGNDLIISYKDTPLQWSGNNRLNWK